MAGKPQSEWTIERFVVSLPAAVGDKIKGWAEFGRLAYSKPKVTKRDFPQSWAVCKQQGLVE